MASMRRHRSLVSASMSVSNAECALCLSNSFFKRKQRAWPCARRLQSNKAQTLALTKETRVQLQNARGKQIATDPHLQYCFFLRLEQR